jgi:phosphoserine aminotransferase
MFSMYVSLLVLKHYETYGGLAALERADIAKGNKIYEALARGEDRGIYKMRVRDGSRSWMNVVFEVLGEGQEEAFFKEATQTGLRGFKGHRYGLSPIYYRDRTAK